jgi:hypothetical protein
MLVVGGDLLAQLLSLGPTPCWLSASLYSVYLEIVSSIHDLRSWGEKGPINVVICSLLFGSDGGKKNEFVPVPN